MKTFEQIAIDKLREIEPTNITKWAEALGYKNGNAFWHTLKKLVKEELIIEDTTRRPYSYTVNKMEGELKDDV